jgi:uncharacterized protein (TIGR03067 family)
MRLMLTAVLGVGLVGAAVAQDAAQALKALEGTYTIKSGSRGGKPIPPEVAANDQVVIKGDTITISSKAKNEVAKLKVDPSKKPAHVDVISTRATGRSFPGIYKLDNGELTLVYSRDPDAPRPKDFDAKGKGQIKMVLVKKTGEKK